MGHDHTAKSAPKQRPWTVFDVTTNGFADGTDGRYGLWITIYAYHGVT
jgi:hypothetical protein